MLEALIGQMFPAILLARLVSLELWYRQRRFEREQAALDREDAGARGGAPAQGRRVIDTLAGLELHDPTIDAAKRKELAAARKALSARDA